MLGLGLGLGLRLGLDGVGIEIGWDAVGKWGEMGRNGGVRQTPVALEIHARVRALRVSA